MLNRPWFRELVDQFEILPPVAEDASNLPWVPFAPAAAPLPRAWTADGLPREVAFIKTALLLIDGD